MTTFREDAENVYTRDQLLKTYAMLDANSVTAKVLLAEVDRLSNIIDINTSLTALSAGRLLADNETPFTAEQVEDIRIVVFRALHPEDEVVQACRRLESALLQMDQGAGKGHPATAETEWQTWQEVPDGRTVRTRSGHIYTKRDGDMYIGVSAMKSHLSITADDRLAPFVAAEEG